MRVSNIPILALFRSAAEQNHDGVTVFTEVDSIPRPEIDAVLEHAGTDAFDVREVSQLQPPKRCRYLCSCCSVETAKPRRKRARTGAVEIFENRQDPYGNIKVTTVKSSREPLQRAWNQKV